MWLGLYDLDVDTNTLFDDIYWICCGQREHRLAREDATLAAVLQGQKKMGRQEEESMDSMTEWAVCL